MLERVQGGLIGQTLSSFGIIGLYITVVLAIGRFLRFSTRNMRMRIQYEDLPTTKRLVTMCQVDLQSDCYILCYPLIVCSQNLSGLLPLLTTCIVLLPEAFRRFAVLDLPFEGIVLVFLASISFQTDHFSVPLYRIYILPGQKVS